ncbi:MAG TPA: DUF72 domain-containing protein [Candidatus Hypogeohydataceae bacterium YC40]
MPKKTQKTLTAFTGTSGFMYPHWGRGVFYPEHLPQRKWLEHYAEYFDTVELNVTFYRLPTAEAFKSWYKRSPRGFAFALKGSRFITHIKRLKDCQSPLKLYFERARLLKEKLSVVLWQLPPRYKKDAQRLRDFIKALKPYTGYRHAFEFRDPSWLEEQIYELLKEADMAICEADWPCMPQDLPLTASFAYLRRHGPGGLYSGCYSKAFLKQDARRIKDWLDKGRSVYIYFNNDADGWAVRNAIELKEMLKE